MAQPTLQSQQQVAALYISMLGRDPEPEGFSFWVNAMTNGRTQSQIASAMSSSPEFVPYLGLTTEAAVERMYENILGREATPEDNIAFWTSGVTGWQNTGLSYAEALGQVAVGITNAAFAMPTSTRDGAFVQAEVAQAIQTGTATPTATYTLTTNIDTINVLGIGNADVVTAGLQNAGGVAEGETWNTGDTINGNGNTSVSLIANGTAGGGSIVDVNNVAAININLTADSTINASEFTDVAAVWITSGVSAKALTLSNTDLTSAYGVSVARGLTYNINSTATGTADEATLVASGAGLKATAVGDRATFDVSGGNAVEAVTLSTSGKNFVNIVGSSTTATIEITGAGENNTLITNAAALMTIDASATTGKNTVDVGTLLGTGDTIIGGSGADTLKATLSAALPLSAEVEGFETLDLAFTAAATYNASKTTGATELRLTPTGSIVSNVTNLADSVQTIKIGSTAAITATGDNKVAYATGSNSDVDFVIGATPTSGTAAVSIGAVVISGNKGGLSIESNGSAANTTGALTANTVTSLDIASGTQALTVGAISATAAATIGVDGTTKNVTTGKITGDESTTEININSGAGVVKVSADGATSGDGIALASSADEKDINATINVTSAAKAVTLGAVAVTAADVASDNTATVNLVGGVGEISTGIMTFTGGKAAGDVVAIEVNATATDGTVTIAGITLDEKSSTKATNVANVNLTTAGGDVTLTALLLTNITSTNLTVSAASGDTATVSQINGASDSSTVGNLSSITAEGAGTIVIGNASPTTATSVDGDTVVDATATTGNFSVLLGNANSGNVVTVYLGNAATDKSNTVVTGEAADFMFGGSGVDIISGGAGADYIEGRAGNDIITGGAGADIINVGTGTDTITIAALTDTLNSGTAFATGLTVTAADIVTGMGNGDKINLEPLAISASSVGTAFASDLTADAINIIRGTYNGTTFTAGTAAGDNDYFVQIVETTGTDTNAGFVMVDIVGTVTATVASEVVTLAVA